jgi:hypothetical protein
MRTLTCKDITNLLDLTGHQGSADDLGTTYGDLCHCHSSEVYGEVQNSRAPWDTSMGWYTAADDDRLDGPVSCDCRYRVPITYEGREMVVELCCRCAEEIETDYRFDGQTKLEREELFAQEVCMAIDEHNAEVRELNDKVNALVDLMESLDPEEDGTAADAILQAIQSLTGRLVDLVRI